MNWKLVLWRSFGVGAGAVFTIAVLFAAYSWYATRPQPPKPWDKKALIAEYDYIDTEENANNVVFYYAIENATDSDYKLDKKTDAKFMGKLKARSSLSSLDTYEMYELPIYIPAKHRVRFAVHSKQSYPVKKPAQEDAAKQWRKELITWVQQHWGNLDGFVLFDERYRYEIELPKGW